METVWLRLTRLDIFSNMCARYICLLFVARSLESFSAHASTVKFGLA